jgi:hypothetical protein
VVVGEQIENVVYAVYKVKTKVQQLLGLETLESGEKQKWSVQLESVEVEDATLFLVGLG